MFPHGLFIGLRLFPASAPSSLRWSLSELRRNTVTELTQVCHGTRRCSELSKLVHRETDDHDNERLKCTQKSQPATLESLRLSSEEVSHYLRHTLGIPSAHTKLKHDRLGLLQEITLKTHFRQPFQNITNTYAIPLSERKIPSVNEIKEAMLQGQGGVCYELNIFTNRLLAALGYSVHLIGGKFMGHDRYHVTNIVRDAEVKGQCHLVEVGASDPTFYPIPLNFGEDSPVYQDSFLVYRFKLIGQKYLQRYHVIRQGDLDMALLDDHAHSSNWRLISEMDIDTDCDLEHFKEPMSYVFNALPRPKLKMFEEGMFAMIYKEGNMVYIKDNHCYVEKGDSIERRVMDTMEQVLEAYGQFMPMIPQEKIRMGLGNRNLTFEPLGEEQSVTFHPIARDDNAVNLSQTYLTK
ncbi:uncharacterized protein LOC121420707 [Lytechinus variegatus]|uniref:uncharacterized protein LOC121420707 n=1 Tax=Lytechinus variegatus TaxID=7654 RepID=UPI001BB1EF6F|nr:uncharacterized protein LOC121420707 [Lytechinus variegatus]